MNILALTSSSTQASVALQSGEVLIERIHATPRGTSEFMNSAIDELLREASIGISDLNLIAVDQGPGSFTGIRVSISVARSLCYMLNLPCLVTQSLLLLASQVTQHSPQATVLCGMNAYKNLIFFSHFHAGEQSALKALSPAEIEESCQTLEAPFVWAGNGLEAYRALFSPEFLNQISQIPGVSDHPRASALASLARQSSPSTWIQDWKFIAPLYLRDSAAEESLRSRS